MSGPGNSGKCHIFASLIYLIYTMKKLWLMFFSLLTLSGLKTYAQGEIDERAMIFKMNGIEVKTRDSSFYANFRFRMQNRLGFSTQSADDLGIEEFDARVRRLRLRADGYVLNPKFGYSIQLSFTRGDMDVDNTGIANIVRDAVIFYHFTDNFYVAFGQNKLPGNRQRVNSSGQMQFAERSIVNSTFTLDRDFGIKAYYDKMLGNVGLRLKGAISTGDGRSVNSTNNGLAYTGRVEVLPLGMFTKDGDYSEGDLEREQHPRLSLAAGYSYNAKATRTGGQLGKELYAERDMRILFCDMIFKYNGWSCQSEFMRRTADDPLTYNADGNLRYIYTGWGNNTQFSYLFKSNFEPALRYSILQPQGQVKAYEDRREVLEAGISKYLRGHRIKAQFNLSYNTRGGDWATSRNGNYWGGVFQVELGI